MPQSADQVLPFAPMLIGGHRALDFLNSVFTPQAEPVDFLRDGATLLAWVDATQLLPSPLSQAVLALKPRQRDALAGELRGLRDWLRDLLARWTAQGVSVPSDADLARLNGWLAGGPLRQSATRAADGSLALLTERAPGASAVVAELAAACVELLSELRPDQVRKCENPACTLWFADGKRGPRRRWCSMAACGNRSKAAAHRARARGDGAA
ncbi:CGNR zinc finger domain-containing protein [Derxia lacustris]|uniref:CGNR zinc finger domain-containing protein n=1 Tax=Derxia lacustris TaxID=764842 RepID=UPI000A171D29|nr:CGNR zinc finger domain-containing protein [Derxia lacustris]